MRSANYPINRRTRNVVIFPNDPANGLRPTASTLAWWGPCCWSKTSTGSWRAAACFPLRAWPPSRSLATSPPCRLSAPEKGSTQTPGDRGCSAPTGRSGLDHRPGPAAVTLGCRDHSSSQHIRDRTKDLTRQSSRSSWPHEAHLHLRKDSRSFHPVHPLLRAFGPRILHHLKGLGRFANKNPPPEGGGLIEQLAGQRSSRSFDAAADTAGEAEGSTGAEQGQGAGYFGIRLSLVDKRCYSSY